MMTPRAVGRADRPRHTDTGPDPAQEGDMSRLNRPTAWGLAVAAVVFSSSAATAQAINPYAGATPSPTISPYLNLLRYGNPPYLNYYGLVQPQLQAQEQFQNLQAQYAGLAANQQAMTAAGGLQTGTRFGYFTHRGYFLNNRGGLGGRLGGGLGGLTGGTGGGVQPGAGTGTFGGLNGFNPATGFGRTNNPYLR
jgi:hypothetical protein